MRTRPGDARGRRHEGRGHYQRGHLTLYGSRPHSTEEGEQTGEPSLSLFIYPLLVDLVVWMYVYSQVSTQRAQLKCAVIMMHACKSVLPTSKVQACSKTRHMDYKSI